MLIPHPVSETERVFVHEIFTPSQKDIIFAEKVQFTDKVVGIIEARDGTIMDVVRQIKPFEFAE